MSRLIDAEDFGRVIREYCKDCIEHNKQKMDIVDINADIQDFLDNQPTAFDVDIRDTQLELHTIKLLTLGAKAYATWFDIITSKMRGNDEIAKLFLELPTVQGTSNIMSLERLKDNNIDVNSISSLEDVIKAIS